MSATVSQGSGATTTGPPCMSELCRSLVKGFAKGNITKTEAIQEIIEAFRESSAHKNAKPVQTQEVISVFISMLDQAQSSWVDAAMWGGVRPESTSEADPKEDTTGTIQTDPNWGTKTPEPQEEGQSMSPFLHGWMTKKARFTNLLPAKSSWENWSKTRLLTSRSQNITSSAPGDSLSSLTQSGQKSYRVRQLTSMLSSQGSIPLSPTTEQQRHWGISSSDLDIQNPPKLSRAMGMGLSHSVHSSEQCSLSSHI